ncbi:MAG: hypothetical protein WAM21_06530, partial [Steroidobacteraceae bacterium]
MSTVVESLTPRRVRLGNVEPALLSLLKQLDPLITVVSLAFWQLIYGDPLTPAFGALALLAFIISSGFFTRSDAQGTPFGWGRRRSYSGILVQWGSVVGVLLLAAFAFKVTDLFSRKVFLTWFLTTPIALSGAHALRERARWWT